MIDNPLLDLIILNGKDILTKYSILDGDIITFTSEYKDLIKDIEENKMTETIRIKLGGCGLNTTLVYQLNHKDTATIFCGSIGNDKNGSLLKKMMETSQIQSFFYINDSKPTGRTFNFIDCEKKTLLCHCEAPKYFPLNYLKDNLHMVDECAVVYTTNFFESKDCSKYLATYCSSKNILFSFNLSNPLYVSINAEFIKQIWPEIDILFGNLSEYEALVEIFNLQKDDINNSIKYLSNLNNKPHSKKLIVITNDQHPCIICDGICLL